MVMALVVSLSLAGAPKLDARLVGTWLAGAEPFFTLAADGSGRLDDAKVRWTADGTTLSVVDAETGETDRGTYVVEGDRMTLTMAGLPVQLVRAGGRKQPAKAEAALPAAAPPPRAAGVDQLSQLLLSSAWCTFRYNQTTGASNSSRVQFLRNGTWSLGARGETYNSGANGTVAGQYDSGDSGQWAVRNGTLWMSEGQGPLQPLGGFAVTRNSSGSPVITADGREYTQCQ